MRHHRFIRLVVAIIGLVNSRLAIADNDRAEELFRSGREAIVRGDNASGCALLAESDRIEPSPGAKLGLAMCAEQLDQRISAWRLFRAVMRLVDPTDERWRIANRHLDALKADLAIVTLTIAGTPPAGARIVSDGAEVTASDIGQPIPFDPGRHSFALSVQGRETTRLTLVLESGTARNVELPIGKPLRAGLPGTRRPLVLPTSPANSPRVRPVIGLALEGAAGGMLLNCLPTGGLAWREKRAMDSECSTNGSCSETGLRAAERGATFASISTGTFIAGAITAAIGGLFLLMNDGEQHPGPAGGAARPGMLLRF
jgi:hypothetical protein